MPVTVPALPRPPPARPVPRRQPAPASGARWCCGWCCRWPCWCRPRPSCSTSWRWRRPSTRSTTRWTAPRWPSSAWSTQPDGSVQMSVSRELDYALRADRFDEVHWVLQAPDGHVVAGDPGAGHARRAAGGGGLALLRRHLGRRARARRDARTGSARPPRRGARRAAARRASPRRSTSAAAWPSTCPRRPRRPCWSRPWCSR